MPGRSGCSRRARRRPPRARPGTSRSTTPRRSPPRSCASATGARAHARGRAHRRRHGAHHEAHERAARRAELRRPHSPTASEGGAPGDRAARARRGSADEARPAAHRAAARSRRRARRTRLTTDGRLRRARGEHPQARSRAASDARIVSAEACRRALLIRRERHVDDARDAGGVDDARHRERDAADAVVVVEHRADRHHRALVVEHGLDDARAREADRVVRRALALDHLVGGISTS